MNPSRNKFSAYLGRGMLFLLFAFLPARSQSAPKASRDKTSGTTVLPWHIPAKWHRGLLRKQSGTLTISDSGVAFGPAGDTLLRWPFDEIQTFDLTPHWLVVTGYQNRPWRLPGERKFRFGLLSPMPPSVAATLARRVGKPSENGIPNPNAPAIAVIAARHRRLDGGTNGILRFREAGIDFVTRSGQGERSWRWADIETIAQPNPYELEIEGYREIFDFELKRPLSRQLSDQLWDGVYGQRLIGLAVSSGPGGQVTATSGTRTKRSGVTAAKPEGRDK